MPPRRRAAAGSGSRTRGSDAATLLSLPDSLLIEILQHIDEDERHEQVALVCKRLLALTRSPELLESCCIDISGSHTSVLPRLRAALAFLCSHGKHIQRLDLNAEPASDPAYPAHAASELEALVASCLAVVGAAGGQLSALSVGEETPLVSTAWLPPLAALAELELGGEGRTLQLPDGFSKLSCLTDANLYGDPLHLPADGLPPSLTRLVLHGTSTAQLSGAQASLSRLTNLCKLQLGGTDGPPADLAALCNLSSLTLLELASTPLPSCLPGLSQLATLAVAHCEKEEGAALDAAVGRLTQLRRLAINCPALTSMPPSLTALASLERLFFDCGGEDSLHLPPGAWRSSLRWLGLGWVDVMKAVNDGALAQMAQLEYLCLVGNPTGRISRNAHGWGELWAFLTIHPTLRCVGLDMAARSGKVELALLDALIDMKHSRPALQLRRIGRDGSSSFFDEVMSQDSIPANSG